MTRPIPGQTYKALLWDYEFLLEQSEDECSYCLNKREVQIILTMLDYIGWKTRYIQEKEDIDQTTINHWQANLGRKLMSGCCGDDGTIYRYLPDGTLESSIDGGTTWTPDPNADPRNQAPLAPPLPGADSDAKRCAAADNVRDQYKQMRDNTIALLTAGTTILAIIAGLIGLIGAILAISAVGVGISVLLFGLAAGLLSMTPEEVEAAIDDTALDVFRCIIYCHMDNTGRIKSGEFDNILSDIADQFSGFPETFFYSITATMYQTGLNNAATMGTASASDCDCDCPTPCIDPSWIISGTLVDISETGIRIASGPDFYGRPGEWVAYGGKNPGEFCCKIGSVTLEPSPDVGWGWRNCDWVGSASQPSDVFVGTFEVAAAAGSPFEAIITLPE